MDGAVLVAGNERKRIFSVFAGKRGSGHRRLRIDPGAQVQLMRGRLAKAGGFVGIGDSLAKLTLGHQSRAPAIVALGIGRLEPDCFLVIVLGQSGHTFDQVKCGAFSEKRCPIGRKGQNLRIIVDRAGMVVESGSGEGAPL